MVKGVGPWAEKNKPPHGDQRTYSQIADAWERLPARFRDATLGDGKIRGRLLASCMFGTWVSALDAGGKTGADGPCAWSNHDFVWTAARCCWPFPERAR